VYNIIHAFMLVTWQQMCITLRPNYIYFSGRAVLSYSQKWLLCNWQGYLLEVIHHHSTSYLYNCLL